MFVDRNHIKYVESYKFDSLDTHEFNIFSYDSNLYVNYSYTQKIKESYLNERALPDEISLKNVEKELLQVVKQFRLDKYSISLKKDDEDYPPSFYIQIPDGLSVDEEIELLDSIINELYSRYLDKGEFEFLPNFFIELTR
ncbi:MAG: conserved hypothetical protein [Methanobrevibacter sp. CfCl-M3]